MKAILSLIVGLGITASGSTVLAARIANGNAAELAAHRIEKLVLLKKVPAAFQNQFLGLEVKQITPGGPNRPSFEVIASQEVDEGKVANKISVILDENGKALSHNLIAGTAPTSPTAWKGKDPLTLTELAVHHIEHMMSDAKLPPFYKGMKAIRLSQVQHGTHTMVVVEFLSDLVPEKLEMMLESDGDLISYQVK